MTNPFILNFLQHWECCCIHFQAIIVSVNLQRHRDKDNKIQLIIMDIIQSYYTLSNKNNGVEQMFLFHFGLSRLINKHSLISNKNLLVS